MAVPTAFKCSKCGKEYQAEKTRDAHQQSCGTLPVFKYFAPESITVSGKHVQGAIRMQFFAEVLDTAENNGLLFKGAVELHNRQILCAFKKK